MRRLLVAGALVATLTGCGMGGPAYEKGVPAGVDALVETTSALDFAPAIVTIPAGGTVEWRNVSIMTHTVTAAEVSGATQTGVRLPEGAQPFASGDVPPGQVFRHTFDVPGEYGYVCLPHSDMGMAGTVIVRPAG